MATLTNEQVEQKMQQLKQLTEEMSALTKELVEAGVIKLSDKDLEKATGGKPREPKKERTKEEIDKFYEYNYEVYRRYFEKK